MDTLTTTTTPQIPKLDMQYRTLPDALHATVEPYGASSPKLVAYNGDLGRSLGFDISFADEPAAAATFFAGNHRPAPQPALAMAYAGHQFGGFVPRLGDGRAHLLGEAVTESGERFDIQLKGSGQTPFSRQGDGRAALGPVLREYVVAEAMAALGIPTSRALAAVLTGDMVLREGVQPGAILTRVAASHLRVGTFEYAARLSDPNVLDALVQFALQRHPVETDADIVRDGRPGLTLLQAVIARQAKLIAQWMGVGFIHGVMNTDNCTISGETIDYGPCAFMDGYNPAQVYSSIDHMGRYAFANQPGIAHWNMAVLAQALLRAIDPNEETAVSLAQEAVNHFPAQFEAAYRTVMRTKLALPGTDDGDVQLIDDLLGLMAESEADFTGTFRALGAAIEDGAPLVQFLGADASSWLQRWRDRLGNIETAAIRVQLNAVNPAIMPRNHRVEAMIAAAYDGDFEPFSAMVEALKSPYAEPASSGQAALLATPPAADEVVHATFCGT